MDNLLQKNNFFEKALRIFSDLILINASLLIALTARFLWILVFGPDSISVSDLFGRYVSFYLSSFWLITALNLTVFYASGLYSHQRFYQGKYKALAVTQGVSIGYLLFGFFCLILPDVFFLPRSVVIMAWGLNLFMAISARLWMAVWNVFAKTESKIAPAAQPDGDTPKRILVIGGAGYVGSALLPKLLERGYFVRVLDLLMFGVEPIKDVLHHPNLEIISADFRQVDKVVTAARGMDTIIHLGAIVGDPACSIDENLTIETNLMATRMIAEVAKGYRIKNLIFASTCSVYGAGSYILDEHSELNPVSLYAKSKIASERILQKLSDDSFSPVILRFGTIYGFSGRTRFDLVINLLTATAAFDDQIKIFGGDQWRPFVHVDDVALAILKTLEAPHNIVRNQIFNVGSNEQNYTIQQIGELIHEAVPGAEVKNMYSDGDKRDYRVDFTKIEKFLNFYPQWTVEKGIQQVLEAIREGKVSDYRHRNFSNYKFFQEQTAQKIISPENGWVHRLLNEPQKSEAFYDPAVAFKSQAI